MDYEQEQNLQRQAADAGERGADARRQLALGRAGNMWDAGDRVGALSHLHRAGFDADMVPFCRERNLTPDEAQDLAARVPEDYR